MIAAIAIPLLVGAFSAYLTADDMKIYESLGKPFLAPPGWLFPIVWTILYALMGLASYFVFTADAEEKVRQKALRLYAVQLAMNLFWSTLFFTYHQYLISLIWLLIMWVLILITGLRFFKIRKEAGIMMGILFIWTTFAAYLNLSYYIMSINVTPLTMMI